MICSERTAALRIGVLPTLPYHAGVSMQAYAAGLIESLAELPGVHAALLTPPFASRSGVSWARNRWIRYVAYPAWAATQRADVYHIVDHGNAQLLWWLPRARTVVTCHDLYPLGLATGRIRFPGAPPRAWMVPTALRLLALRRARLILAVSQHTADECRRYLGIPPARCRVVYESVSSEFWAPSDDAEVAATRARHGIGPEDIAILHVGTNDARKNLSAVCQVVARLRARTARAVRLVKVGVRLGPEERAMLRLEGVPVDAVRDVGGVDAAELVRIYHAATVLLYPSFYEGFCRPVVEAMATGLPVVAAGGGAIPEVTGGAASLHDPGDVEGMATRIADIAENPGLRQEMAGAGREATRRFSADGHGALVADVYREVGLA
jgi:glycosyltransferase involved in cell wall biosynthesis